MAVATGAPRITRLSILILAGWLLVLLFAQLAGLLAAQLIRPPDPQALQPILPSLRGGMAPEPVERSVFLGGLVMVPPLLWGLLRCSGLARIPAASRWRGDRLETLLATGMAALLLSPMPASGLLRNLLGSLAPTEGAAWRFTLLCLALAVGIALVQRRAARLGRRLPAAVRRGIRGAGLLLTVGSVCLALLSFRVFSFGHLSDHFAWTTHFEVVVSGLARVRAGGTLLATAPSQYGLFPELMAPWLTLLPAGVLGVTLAFAVLELIALAALLHVLRRWVRQPLVFTAACLGLAMLTFQVSALGEPPGAELDPYFQYLPLRVVGPALSVPISLWVLRRPQPRRLVVAWFWIGLCLFWNLDSGAAILYAFTMSLLLLTAQAGLRPEATTHSRPFLALATLLTPLASLAVMALGLLLLWLKAGQPLQLAWLTSSQQLFYGLGYMMVPLPWWPDAYFVVLAVYAMALLLALSQLPRRPAAESQLVLLYLALLGAGLFTYYQGRSLPGNLASVSWPMILILAILCDRHLTALRHSLVPAATLALPVAGLTGLLLPSLTLLIRLPTVVRHAAELRLHQPARQARPAPELHSERAMVRRHCGRGERGCLILSRFQAIYALESGHASAWEGPSRNELVLQADVERLRASIRAGEPERILLGVGPSAVARSMGITAEDLGLRYRATAHNPERTMVLLQRRGSDPSRP